MYIQDLKNTSCIYLFLPQYFYQWLFEHHFCYQVFSVPLLLLPDLIFHFQLLQVLWHICSLLFLFNFINLMFFNSASDANLTSFRKRTGCCTPNQSIIILILKNIKVARSKKPFSVTAIHNCYIT